MVSKTNITKHWFLGLTDLLKVKRTETHSMIIDFQHKNQIKFNILGNGGKNHQNLSGAFEIDFLCIDLSFMYHVYHR